MVCYSTASYDDSAVTEASRDDILLVLYIAGAAASTSYCVAVDGEEYRVLRSLLIVCDATYGSRSEASSES